MAATTDQVTVDAGERRFKTSKSALCMSGSKYFEAVFTFISTNLTGKDVLSEQNDMNIKEIVTAT